MDQWIDSNGKPLSGGLIYTYIPDTFTPKDTWQDSNRITINTNPIVLDVSGRALIYGDGDYRFIITDSVGNLIYDGITSEFLVADFISAAMIPVTQAETTQQARDLMGVTAAIQSAVANLELLTGPTGPQGIAGAQGPIGPTGASVGYQPGGNGGNPGFVSFPNINGSSTSCFFQWGQSVTNGTGSAVVNFATAFPSACEGVQLTVITSLADVGIQLRSFSNNGITVTTSGIGLPGGGFHGPIAFTWFAYGF